jgi:hypothetical protein
MPAIHASMTEAADGQNPRRTLAVAWRDIPLFSSSAGERKLMTHFVVKPIFFFFDCGFTALGLW